MKLDLICNEMEKIAPTSTALSFDNVGLLVGDKNKDIQRVLIALDLTREVMQEAIEKKADLIITHHPLIFNPLKKITNDNVIGEILIKLIKNDIAYYASHTNLDKSEFGTNKYLANLLEINNPEFVDDDDLICVFGNVDKTIEDVIFNVKEKLSIDYVRFVDGGKTNIKKMAVSTGSGDSYKLFGTCIGMGIDLLVTGDLTYHTMQFAKDNGLSVVDATHFKTENIIKDYLKIVLDNRFKDVEIISSDIQQNVFGTL